MPGATMSIDPAIWIEPVRGGYPAPTLFGLPGLEQVRAFFQRKSLPPPIHHLTGMQPTEAQPGSATFTMPASPWLLCPQGFVQLGVVAILADGPLGSAIQTALPPFTGYTTAELSMNYARPVTPESGTLVARGRLIFAGRSLGLSETVIEDARGRIVAHSTSRCVIFPPMGPPPSEVPEHPSLEWPASGTPDPYLRPPAGTVIPQDVWDRTSGLDVLRQQIEGILPIPPVTHLTGMRPTEASDGACTFVLPATEWLCSPLGTVEGGVTAMLADSGDLLRRADHDRARRGVRPAGPEGELPPARQTRRHGPHRPRHGHPSWALHRRGRRRDHERSGEAGGPGHRHRPHRPGPPLASAGPPPGH